MSRGRMEHPDKHDQHAVQQQSSERKASSAKNDGGQSFGSESLSSASILQLQRTIGNQAVQRMLSGKGSGVLSSETTGEAVGKGVDKGGMPAALQLQMEQTFNTDFSQVRIHPNSPKAPEIDALAYTQGNDIHFAPGQFQPNSTGGQALLGHELTHVVQQRQGRVQATTQANGVPVNDDPALEKEADHMGKLAAQRKQISRTQEASPFLGSGVEQTSSRIAQRMQADVRHMEANGNVSLPTNEAPVQMTKSGAAGGGLFGMGLGLGLGYLASLSNPVTALAMLALGAGGALVGNKLTEPAETTAPPTPIVPSLMHFVWLGGRLPAEREQNIITWSYQASHVTVNLWLDEHSERVTNVSELQRHGIEIRNTSELYDSAEELEATANKLPTYHGGRVNPAAAGALSDVVRLEILYKEGGTYMDSDNTPGAEATSFAGMDAPLGVRLGWAQLEHSKAFSNDAISAVPGNKYIDDYRKHVYGKLADDDQVANILSGNRELVKAAVMNTTGPEAMAEVALPFSDQQRSEVDKELSDNRYLKDLLGETYGPINISSFGKNLTANEDSFTPAMQLLFDQLAYPEGAFVRASDNAWLNVEGRQ
ncbi:eCIS core domain-containing protein [Paenibacillus sp. 481]|uniref:eCIS core domain-containing protein n=1 Tax=Paenibacillus sp. 481 TaxID=2835869 RepID=UPI001E30110B|nr:DUF4157 domain-containing protein [Paenibacillus sp. 481]UHA73453.1 DUF4157 domain-containing protein [Paenibacillus sp. 481]